jgi:NAD(P)-dependent dehydrogenase (short-subunit alcohol dehydrogenase family)
MTDFDGLVALVTGGASGIGAATADLLQQRGARVAVLDRVTDGAPDGVLAAPCDVTDRDGVDRAVTTVVDRFGRLDVVVNNAGIGAVGDVSQNADDEWARVLDVNVTGLMLCTREAVRRMSTKNGGRGGAIVNLSSIAAALGGANQWTAYAAAKGAVNSLTIGLAREWAADGIAVLALAAGHFDTESLRKYPDVVWQSAARSVPLQRLGREEEHAWLVALAASPLGHALSGSVITLDGARDNWFGPWPPASLVESEGSVPTEERRAR